MYLSRDSLQALAAAKIQDAELLLQHNRCSNAYYLSGYALELGFKAAISKLFLKECLPDRDLVMKAYTHDLGALLGLAGLKADFSDARKANPILDANWSTASQWSQASRYEMIDEFKATEMVNAIRDLDHGVLTWLKHHW